MRGVVEHYDGRAGMEADLKSDKQGLGLAVIRKRLLPAQKMVVLLVQLAHNLLMWARSWLGKHAPASMTTGLCASSSKCGPFRGGSSCQNRRKWYASAYDGHIPEHARCARGFCPCFPNGRPWSF